MQDSGGSIARSNAPPCEMKFQWEPWQTRLAIYCTNDKGRTLISNGRLFPLSCVLYVACSFVAVALMAFLREAFTFLFVLYDEV